MNRKRIFTIASILVVAFTTSCKKENVNPDELVQANVVIKGDVTHIKMIGTNPLKESNYKNAKVWMIDGQVLNYKYTKLSETEVDIDITTSQYKHGEEYPELYHRWVLANGNVDTLKVQNYLVSTGVTYDLH
jgi:hypothetical protein